MERLIEKWQDKISEVTIGAKKPVKIGGETGIFFIDGEDKCPNPPKVAMEVWDMEPEAWPETLKANFGKALKTPGEWAKMCAEKFGADIICLRLASIHPDSKNTSSQDAGKVLEEILGAVSIPLIVIGSGSPEKDNDVLLHCANISKGQNCLFGIATQNNYKTLTAACVSNGHSIISEAPIDINIAKQLNILICDMQFPADKIVIHHATGALGYGLEYTYSIMERTRLAGISGDKMLSMPMISFVGQEAWRTKEAKTGAKDTGIMWEITSATAYLNSGADILVLNHPKAVSETKKTINNFTLRQ
ncbi:MAG: acetyl-CoA decarbonylase/synthase complex subunit delta [Candidatus Omnitrophota bacterium]|nr:acetyl-CoA decarbonylase/synthase complex subunit delta [Candidatus Omnitrophota bacterium]